VRSNTQQDLPPFRERADAAQLDPSLIDRYYDMELDDLYQAAKQAFEDKEFLQSYAAFSVFGEKAPNVTTVCLWF
jgi:hypothetical protein